MANLFNTRTVWAIVLSTIIVAVAFYSGQTLATTSNKDERRIAGEPQTFRATAQAVSAEVISFAARPIKKKTRPDKVIIPGELSTSSEASMPAKDADAALATRSGIAMPTPLLTFDGLSNFDNINAYSAYILPPDMNGDVGPSHYVQTVNLLFRVYDKTGSALSPPIKYSDLFAPLGTACSTRNDGDPIVLYDTLADRWVISQFCTNFPPFRQLIAVSQNGDPLGSYFLYEFVMPNNRLNDFPKFGVWPDGYYMSTEEFVGSDYVGMGAFAFEREKMLVGDPTASYIYFSKASISSTRLGNLLPSDLDGLRPPPAGSPNIFSGYSATEYGESQDAIRLFDFHADFVTPINSTFTERPESPLVVAAFDPTSPSGRTDISQPVPGEKLDSNSDRLNFRAAFRDLGDSRSIVLDQTVRLSVEPYRAGTRVYELRESGGAFAVTEQATLGDTTSSRWIGSAAQDHQGNLAIVFNHVSDTTRPSILYSGKLAAEPKGTFRQESPLMIGTGVQKAFGWRWGDYSSISIDPVDDCTFWMTGEYFTLASEQFSDFTWLTRIGKFKFPECTAAANGSITGNVTNSATGQPISNAIVSAAEFSRSTLANGSYGPLTVVPGKYLVRVSANGYRTATLSLNVAAGTPISQNFALEPIPVIANSATVISAESCGTNGIPEPGETVSFDLSVINNGALTAKSLTIALRPSKDIIAPGPPQNYGILPPGSPAVTRTFAFTVAPNVVCGALIELVFDISEGQTSIGQLNIDLRAGVPKVVFEESFDRTLAGFLPQRWTRSAFNAAGAPDRPRNWAVSSARSESFSKSAFSPNINQVGLGEMISPEFRISTGEAKLTFRNWYEFETTFLENRRYDGSLLEIKLDDGPWQDIIVAGGAFESGGYDGPLDACCQNPLAGRPGWSGRSGIGEDAEFITTSVLLPSIAMDRRVRLRWLVGTDVGGFREGQYIDDLAVSDGYICGCSGSR